MSFGKRLGFLGSDQKREQGAVSLVDGTGGKDWPIRPFVSVSYDHLSQDAVSLIGFGATNLAIESTSLDRITFGYGARMSQHWDKTTFELGAAGYHYRGDTQTFLNSRFLDAGPAGSSFITSGFDIQNQFKIDAGLSQGIGEGWEFSVDGFVEFGDLEGFGGIISISKQL